jgi:two-component system OmpR family sensor kinase
VTAGPTTLGRGLGRSLALATVLGMVMFGLVMVLVYYLTEVGEYCQFAGELEDPPGEIIEQCAIAFAFSLPLGIALSLLVGRKLTSSTTHRLDTVIESASRMTGERLDERLPVSVEQDALDTLSTALNGVFDRIEKGVAAQAQFAADASHELRTPLAVISTNLEVARRKPRDATHWEKVADETLGEVSRMNQLVDKLLLLARAGEAGLHHARTDLASLAALAVERASAIGAKHGVDVELAEGGAVDADVDADAIAIVLDNLLRNAIDHSPKGEHVVVHVERDRTMIVEDRGPGVPEDQRDRIFQPFARGKNRATDRAAGTGLGLGLAICKRIVDGHRGSIHVEDRSGGGARFVVTLPV